MRTIDPNLRGQILEAANEVYNAYAKLMQATDDVDITISMDVASYYNNGVPHFYLNAQKHGVSLGVEHAPDLDKFKEAAAKLLTEQSSEARRITLQERIDKLQAELELLND